MCHSYVIENVSKKSVKISPSKKKLTDMFIRNNAKLFWKKNFIKKIKERKCVFRTLVIYERLENNESFV